MKLFNSISAPTSALLGLLTLVITSCAGVTPYEESVAIDAGFHVATAQDPAWASIPPNHVEPVSVHGRNLYAIRDGRKGVTYVGGETEYRRYQQLIASRGADRVDRLNQQMNQEGLHSFRQ